MNSTCSLRTHPLVVRITAILSVTALIACSEGPELVPQDANPDTRLTPDAMVADAMADTRADADVPTWRSALYPEGWEPGWLDSDGRGLHDFSYAGYRHGQTPPSPLDSDLPSYDVSDFGADPSGTTDSTNAIQAAIDAATEGGTINIPPGLFRIDGELVVRSSNTLLHGAGPDLTRLHFTTSRDRSYKAHLSFLGNTAHDTEIPLAEDEATRSMQVRVMDAGDLAPGDDISIGWTITEEFVEDHGMTGTWQAFNGRWQPFFWRTIISIDRSATPHRITIDVPLRSAALLRDSPSLRRHPGLLSEVGIEDVGVSNAVGWSDAWSEDQVHAIGLDGVKDAWVRRVESFVSPSAPASGDGSGAHLQSSGILVKRAMRVSVLESRMEFAQHRGGGGNGYLFEVRQSSEVLFQDCVARAGRHGFIQNWGFGATGIVWSRVHSLEGRSFFSPDSPISQAGFSEFHHSLATANLIDQSRFDDGWSAVNRGDYSSGAGHSATETVFYNSSGSGSLRSAQYGWGYVIGTSPEINIVTRPFSTARQGTEPEDFVEGAGLGQGLQPPSLYEDQRRRRLSLSD